MRFAVVGLGYIAQVAVLPAFAHAVRDCELAALVSDDPEKLRKLAQRYRVGHKFDYEHYDELLHSGLIDAVYIALPNHLHFEYTRRAAAAGIHVLCEKPMAQSEDECSLMIDVCAANSVRLMIAYRLHFEAANIAAIELVQSGKLGEPRLFESVFCMQVEDKNNIRLRGDEGGGVLPDIGIYCINAARYLFGEEPLEVAAWSASSNDPRFSEVEEMYTAFMRFPGERLATFSASFGAADVSHYRVVGTRGDLVVEPAFSYAQALNHRLTIDGRTRERTYAVRDQFAPELIHFADCVRAGVDPEPSGQEGLADVRVIQALLRSVETGERVPLDLVPRKQRPDRALEMRRPPVKKPRLINARAPAGS